MASAVAPVQGHGAKDKSWGPPIDARVAQARL